MGVYYKLGIFYEEVLGIVKNFECIVFKIISIDIYVVVIYWFLKYCILVFMVVLNLLFDSLENLLEKLVVIGDFN